MSDVVPTPAALAPRRVHLVTPLLNSWKVTVGLVFFAFWQGREFLTDKDLPIGRIVLIVLGVILAAAIISLVYNFFAWRRMTYGFTEDSLYLHAGILFRSQKHVRLDRIQSVDINQQVLARIFGFSSLKVTSAGGGQENLQLSFVTESEGARLRNEILARAAGLDLDDVETGEVQVAPEAPEQVILALDGGRIIGALVRSVGTVVGVLGVLAITITAIVMGEPGFLVPFIVPVLAVGGFWWTQINTQFNFKVASSPDGLRVRYGLLETTSRTIPPGRVQVVGISQPLLWRRKDWWRLELTIAGDLGDGNQLKSKLYPVATKDELILLLSLVLPDLGTADPRGFIDAAMVGKGSDHGFTTTPRRLRFCDPLTWHRQGFAATDTVVVLRTGRLWRHVAIVPNARIQSLGSSQGPIDRRLGVAGIDLHCTPGMITTSIEHVDLDAVNTFLREQSARNKIARGAAGPERWMEHPGSETGVAESPGSADAESVAPDTSAIDGHPMAVEAAPVLETPAVPAAAPAPAPAPAGAASETTVATALSGATLEPENEPNEGV